MPSDISSIQTVKAPPRSRVSDAEGELNKTNTDSEPFEYPEGGAAAWRTVVGGALISFCGFGYTSSFGVYQDFYTRHYLTNESTSAISWIGGINAFLAAALGLLAGTLYDRGYFYHLLIGGSLLQSFSLFMVSLAQPNQYYQVFLAQGVSLGIAQGVLYVPAIAVVSQYFDRRRTLAMSLIVCGSSLGSIIHPIMLNNLFNRSIGFANGVRISATFVSVLLLTACLLMRTRSGPRKSPPDYVSAAKGVFRDLPFCVVCIGLFCAAIGFYFPLFYLQLDSIQHGNSETFSFYSFVFLNGGSFIGRLSTGFIAPRIGVLMLTTIATIMCGILIFCMIGLGGIPSVVVIGIIYGYFSGIYVALLAPIVADLTTDISQLGARMGISLAFVGCGSLIGGPVSGALLTSQYKWWRSSLFAGLVTLVGSLLLTAVLLAQTRRKHSTEKETP